jgi:nitroimidazol reductase NimA-like FMN-containing flavoprotein (pyridoxamine 5'-phosphate oxidase superfamily)
MNKFLEKLLTDNKVLQIATSENNIPWICNVYFYYHNQIIYYLSDKSAKHSLQLQSNPQVAFALAQYNPEDYDDRKGIQ